MMDTRGHTAYGDGHVHLVYAIVVQLNVQNEHRFDRARFATLELVKGAYEDIAQSAVQAERFEISSDKHIMMY